MKGSWSRATFAGQNTQRVRLCGLVLNVNVNRGLQRRGKSRSSDENAQKFQWSSSIQQRESLQRLGKALGAAEVRMVLRI